jgi:hypothetical protein
MRAICTLLLLGLAARSLPQVVKAEYFYDNAAVSYGQGTPLAVPVNTGNVQITANLPVSNLSPGFHQAFFRVKDATEGWSSLTPKVFMKPWPLENIVGFKYCIDPQTDMNTWTYKTFPSPSQNVTMAVEIDLGNISKGIHYIEAMARSESGIWTPVSKGTFFNLYAEPLNITSLQYYFEADNSSLSPLYTISNFTPSPEITLDSVTFSIPIVSLENLKSYFMYIRAVDESGNKGFFLCDTIVFHGPTGLNDGIYIAPELLVFPNPASDLVNLKFVSLDKASDFIIRLFDDAGRTAVEKEFTFKTDECYTLETSGLMPGVYRIAIYTTSGDPVAKAGFIKR